MNLCYRILNNLTTAVLLFDSQWRVRYVNPAGEMLLGVSARKIIGEDAAIALPCPVDVVDSKFRQVVDLGQPITDRELILSLPDGREITVDCTVMPVSLGQGSEEILLELQQVDRQRRIFREERLISEHLATQALIRGLAHEIKNPLGGLRGASQLLEQELSDRSLHEYTRIIIDEADRLQHLVDRLLGPNRLPEYTEVNIHRVLTRVCSLVKAEVGSRLTIRRDYDPSIPPVYGDHDQMVQALLNLMRNAARAALEGGGVVLVRTRVVRQMTIGNTRHRLVLVVQIEDNGPGIPPELLDRIFYPMVSGSKGGSGLGLSIAQSIVSQHQGLIECQSKPGETLFTVLLPLRKAEDATM